MITIENLTKSYRTPTGRHYVFKNINLKIPEGKNVALIGHNGAGKSTLLRMIGGIDRPDSGRITSKKTISWPLGLSGGFQGSLTGRENVKFIARIYANKENLKNKVNFVEEFSELGKFFDMPIKTYSSGMKSRLSFGISIAFKFDCYLIDEIISVGDSKFRKKCDLFFHEQKKISSFLMVSHNSSFLKRHCESAIIVDAGLVTYEDDISAAIHNLTQSTNQK